MVLQFFFSPTVCVMKEQNKNIIINGRNNCHFMYIKNINYCRDCYFRYTSYIVIKSFVLLLLYDFHKRFFYFIFSSMYAQCTCA